MTRFGQGRPQAAAPRKPAGNAFVGLDLNAGGDQHPQFPFETQARIEVVSTFRATVKGDNVITTVKVIESTTPGVSAGSMFAILQPIGDQWGYGIAKFARMCAIAGNLDEAEQATFVKEAQEGCGVVNAACGDADGIAKYGENPLAGCQMNIYVTRGKDDGKGGNYRDCQFSPVG